MAVAGAGESRPTCWPDSCLTTPTTGTTASSTPSSAGPQPLPGVCFADCIAIQRPSCSDLLAGLALGKLGREEQAANLNSRTYKVRRRTSSPAGPGPGAGQQLPHNVTRKGIA